MAIGKFSGGNLEYVNGDGGREEVKAEMGSTKPEQVLESNNGNTGDVVEVLSPETRETSGAKVIESVKTQEKATLLATTETSKSSKNLEDGNEGDTKTTGDQSRSVATAAVETRLELWARHTRKKEELKTVEEEIYPDQQFQTSGPATLAAILGGMTAWGTLTWAAASFTFLASVTLPVSVVVGVASFIIVARRIRRHQQKLEDRRDALKEEIDSIEKELEFGEGSK